VKVLDIVKEWSIRCAQCGACAAFYPLFVPSCPPSHKFKLIGYSPMGRLMIGRGLSQGLLTLEDDDVLERLYTCTACRSCQVNCGNIVSNHIVDVIEGTRQMAVAAGCMMPGHEIMLESLKKNDNVLGKPREDRGSWAKGLNLKNVATEKADVLYRAGCLLSYEPEVQPAAHDAIYLLQRAGVDVGIEGNEEVCCGGRAYEVGLLSEFNKYAQHNIEAYNKAGVGKVIISCSDGLSHMRLLYPKIKIKMNYEVLHIAEFLDQLVKDGKIKFTKRLPMKVTYHDPCHLGRYAGIYDPPRDILRSIPGLELIEMERSREFSWCCGAGGGVKQAFPEFSLWTAVERIREAKETGAEALVSSCSWCEMNFKEAVKESGVEIEVYDIAEIARKAI
jgi:Fe-S oxidoreductase